MSLSMAGEFELDGPFQVNPFFDISLFHLCSMMKTNSKAAFWPLADPCNCKLIPDWAVTFPPTTHSHNASWSDLEILQPGVIWWASSSSLKGRSSLPICSGRFKSCRLYQRYIIAQTQGKMTGLDRKLGKWACFSYLTAHLAHRG